MRFLPLKPEIGREGVDLSQGVVELRRQRRALGRVRGLLSLAGQRLRGLDQLRDRRNAVIRGLQRLDCIGHRVQQRTEVARTVVQRLRGEEVGRIVERGVDLLPGGETHLGLLDEAFRRLQIKQV